MGSCERARAAARPGSAKESAAAAQRDALGREIAALAALLTAGPGMDSGGEEAEEACDGV